MTHVQHRAVGVDGPVHRVDRAQLDVVGHLGAGGGEHGGEQIRHRQHGGPVVEPEPLALDEAGAAAGTIAALDDRHVVTVADEVSGRRETTEPRTDDDDATTAPARTTNAASSVSPQRASVVMSSPSRAATASVGELGDASLQGVEGTCGHDHILDGDDLVIVEAGGAHAFEDRPLVGVGERHRPGEQRGRLALTQVVTHRLAGQRLVAEGADDVVAHLEGVAKRQPVAAQTGEQLCLALGRGEHGTDMEGPLDRVLAALVAGDALGLHEAPLALHGAEQVEVLADVELDAQLVPQIPHRFGGADQQLVGEDEGEVADEDRHALAEAARLARPRRPAVLVGVHGVRRRRAAPARRVVHHVVVEQGEGVHQLERGARPNGTFVVGVATGPDEAPVAERRAQPLAARTDHPVDLVERSAEVGVDRGPVLPRRGQQLVEADVGAGGDRRQARRRSGGHRVEARPRCRLRPRRRGRR